MLGAEDTATELPFPPVENASQGQSTSWRRRTIFRYPTYPTASNFTQLGAVAHENVAEVNLTNTQMLRPISDLQNLKLSGPTFRVRTGNSNAH